MTSIVIVVAIALLVLLQGGYFSLATCAVGVVVGLAAGVSSLRKGRRSQPVSIVPFLWLGLVASYLASALAHRATLTTLAETGAWAATAGMAFLAAAQDAQQRTKTLRLIAWFGVVTSVAGVLVCAHLLPVYGGMVEDRLQLTFQYANAAAIWYGACLFLCLLSPDAWLRAVACLPALALLLTQSGGALLVFVIVAIVLGIGWARAGEWGTLLLSLAHGAFAAALFALALVLGKVMQPATALVLLPAAFGCRAFHAHEQDIQSRPDTARICRVLVAALVIFVLVACAVLHDRVGDAFATLVERFYHMRDGVALWLTSPLLGIGPNCWQFRYQDIQSAQYYTTVVHSSYVQALVDAGVLGLGFLLAACAAGAKALAADPSVDEGWGQAEFVAVVLVLGHSLIDFDLQFGSIALLVAFLLCGPAGERFAAQKPAWRRGLAKGLTAGLASLLVCVPLCVVGFLCDASSTALTAANTTGDHEAFERMYLGSTLTQADPAATSEYLAVLYAEGRYSEVVTEYARLATPSDGDAIYDILSNYALGDSLTAGEVLVQKMERQPYNREFFRSARTIIDTYGLDASLVARYNAAVDRANALALEASKLLPEQEYVDVAITAGMPAEGKE